MRALILGSKEYPALFKLEGCGGIEVHVQALVENLQRRNVELFVVTRKGGGLNSTEHLHSLHVYRVPYLPGKFFRTFTFNLISFLVSLYLIKRYNVDLIHANDFTSGFFGALAKKLLNRPLVISAPTFGSRQPEWPSTLRAVLQFFERFSMNNADAIFLFTPDDIRYARARYQSADKVIEFLGNGVDVNRFEAAKPYPPSVIDRRITPGSKIITFVGRLTKSKGLDVLIRAFDQLVQQEDAFLVMVGDGPEKNHALNLVAQRSLGNHLVFLGTRRDIEGILKASNIFVLPSFYEGFPIVLLEAMAAGSPIIATRVGVIPTLIHDGVDGLLVKPGDPQELLDKMTLLLHDKRMCDRLSENAYQTVKEHYTWPVILERVYSVYLSLTSHPSLLLSADRSYEWPIPS